MYLSRAFTAQSVEPWLLLISAIIFLSSACLMFWRTWRGELLWLAGIHHHNHYHDHDHDQDHDHDHDPDHDHDHDQHGHIQPEGATSKANQDAPERAHDADLQRLCDGQTVTHGQILLFG
ncbi:nickel/cobalt efflux protein RcnA, partial [Salmonella enterica subsp. enterica serovar Oslo]|nr:nickel/cobalt efflux protein RcnA [Salmonella enterica subsp. enterica serovar Oslo]